MSKISKIGKTAETTPETKEKDKTTGRGGGARGVVVVAEEEIRGRQLMVFLRAALRVKQLPRRIRQRARRMSSRHWWACRRKTRMQPLKMRTCRKGE